MKKCRYCDRPLDNHPRREVCARRKCQKKRCAAKVAAWRQRERMRTLDREGK